MAGTLVLLLSSCVLTVVSETIPEINMSLVRLREDLRVGEFAFKIIATDADNDPLTYKMSGENSVYFNVNANTGNVTIKSQLDREDKETFDIVVSVSDGVYPDVSKKVIIIVIDANDNKPIFTNAPYNKDVLENTEVGTSLFRVIATDADSGLASVVTYNIDDVVPNDGVTLFTISERNGEVRLAGNLNYTSKSTFYQLRINATDGGGLLYGDYVYQSSLAFAFINVIDVPDIDPQFLSLPYTATVEEHTPAGTFVFKVRAIDPDTGVSAKMLYSIKHSNAPDLFQIDENTGDITVKTVFDREGLLDIDAVVLLEVLATENIANIHGAYANTSAVVSITIGDINDNKPKFYKCPSEPCDFSKEVNTFTGDIDEHSSASVAVKGLDMFVRDLDGEANAKFTLKLEGPDKDAFSLSTTSAVIGTPVEIRVRNSQAVDYEEKQVMEVQVIATDISNTADCCSIANVTIHLNDINDNIPTFKQGTYELQIDEHSPAGTIIATITATDPDTADVDKLTYRLLPDSILELFNVAPENGSITVVDSVKLDRETRPFYSATLQARDTANNTGATFLEITLLDINDMTPEIPREEYIEFVKENTSKIMSVKIQAFDGDEPGTNNSKIQFRIEKGVHSDNFTIDKDSGLLENVGKLDREGIDLSAEGKIELNVTASDMGTEPRSSWVLVTVNVEDINDNSPIFRNHMYKFNVKESEKGVFVGDVSAHDADQTEPNNRISFRIEGGNFASFIVITTEGEDMDYVGKISVDPDVELDYERGRRSYLLNLEASDMGKNVDRAQVEVNVIDVNDERPFFNTSDVIHVKENTTGLGKVWDVVANDLDTNHSLIYEMLSMKCQCSGNTEPCKEDWFILESTGAVVVNDKYVIDYEACHQVVMEVQAIDILTEKGENYSLPGILTINIDDINDNPPVIFSSEELFVVVTESTEKDTQVASITATDRDSGENKVITFEVLSVAFIDTNNVEIPRDKIFYADTVAQADFYLGVIRSRGSLDSSLKGQYLVTVEARDRGNLSDKAKLVLYTVDKSYRVGLRFDTSVAYVNENLPQIKLTLTAATKATVHILEVVSESTDQRATEITVLGAYFVYPNGTALNSETVERILQEDLYHANILRKYGLTYIVSGSNEETETNPLILVLIGVVAGLVIVLIVMVTSLVCTQRNYKRKLKAAEAKNCAAMPGADKLTVGAVVPGTNKYTMEGANPVLNLNIDASTDLGFDEEGSNPDRISLNSLDIDGNTSDRMMMIEEEEEDTGSATYQQEDYIEPLGAALAQRRQNVGNSRHFAFDNPSLNTTDL